MENGKNRMQQAQEDVEEVRVIMMDNMTKADERHGKLGELEDRADVLLKKAKVFEKTTAKLKQGKRRTKEVFIGIGVVLAVIILIIIINAIVNGTQAQ